MNSLGFTKFDLSSKSLIPEVKNFENETIRKVLPFIVQEAMKSVSEKEAEYEESRRTVSDGEYIY